LASTRIPGRVDSPILLQVPQVPRRRHDRLGRARRPLHSPGRRGRLADHAAGRALRDQRVFIILRHDPDLGRGRGGKGRRGGPRPITSTGPSPTSRAPWPPTSCMTARSASSSAVDNRTLKRLAYRPRPEPLPDGRGRRGLLPPLPRHPGAHGLTSGGVATDGSAQDPGPIAAVFGDVPHPV
jgi:hypothetical protein